MVGTVGIRLKATLKIGKLLIPLNEKDAKNAAFAEVRYTPGTRRDSRPKTVRRLKLRAARPRWIDELPM